MNGAQSGIVVNSATPTPQQFVTETPTCTTKISVSNSYQKRALAKSQSQAAVDEEKALEDLVNLHRKLDIGEKSEKDSCVTPTEVVDQSLSCQELTKLTNNEVSLQENQSS